MILRILNHPFILKFYELFETSKYIILVIELAIGGYLNEALKNMKYIHELDALKIVKKMLLSLQYISSKGIIHRDIKPDNILL